MTYASGTTVSVQRSRVEIEDLLIKYKASRIGVVTEPDRATVGFTIGSWSVRFKMPLPTEAEAMKQRTRQGFTLSHAQKSKWIEQTTRERWRALGLTIKAKLVSVECRVETFEEAFMAHLVLGGHDGQTIGEQSLPQLRDDNRKLLGAGAPQAGGPPP